MLTWARWWCLWICPSRCGTSFAQRRSVRTAFRLNFRGSQGSLLRGGGGLWVFLTRLDKYFPLLAALRVTCTRLDRPSAVFILRKKEVGYWSVRSAKSWMALKLLHRYAYWTRFFLAVTFGLPVLTRGFKSKHVGIESFSYSRRCSLVILGTRSVRKSRGST